jgi:hypothetical protein
MSRGCQVWPANQGPHCGNMMLMSGCMVDCQHRFGGCIVSPEERQRESKARRESFDEIVRPNEP